MATERYALARSKGQGGSRASMWFLRRRALRRLVARFENVKLNRHALAGTLTIYERRIFGPQYLRKSFVYGPASTMHRGSSANYRLTR